MRSVVPRLGTGVVATQCKSNAISPKLLLSPSISSSSCPILECGSSRLLLLSRGRTLVSTIHTSTRSFTQLAPVGRFEAKQPDENLYLAGQPFLHRIFGYRGVTLFPWLARVHDIDIRKQYPDDNHFKSLEYAKSHIRSKRSSSKSSDSDESPDSTSVADGTAGDSQTKRSKGGFIPANKHSNGGLAHDGPPNPRSQSIRFHPYYQVLIDTRDCPYVSNRTQTEAVTFLGHPEDDRAVYSIKGLDYVAHEDILPYTTFEEQPVAHELHKKLFKFDAQSPGLNGSKFCPSDLLDTWRHKHPWLDLSRVYRETTENVRVTVIPFYLGQSISDGIPYHWWRYSIRLENFSDINVQLRERHWKIFSQIGKLQTIKGRGVVGVEPLLTKSEPAYQYSSHVHLQDKNGHMWGTFKMQREDGYTFECRIPPFSLVSSADPTSVPPAPSVPLHSKSPPTSRPSAST